MVTYIDLYICIGIAVGIGISIAFLLLVFTLGRFSFGETEDEAQPPDYRLMEHQDNVSPSSYRPFPSPPPPYTVLDNYGLSDVVI